MPRVGYKLRYQDMVYANSTNRGMNQFGMNYGLFMNAIRELGSQEQKDFWNEKISAFRVLGCYAQTELGHGSDVQNLETTATFDKEADEFVINTPRLEAAKFWPGELARVANHALVMAKLLVQGRNLGQHMFIVPIRSLEDHSVLPGIELGDIGPKLGFHLKDNGFAIFKGVRIPRANMLSGYQELTRDGLYRKKGNPKLLYISLLNGRFSIVRMSHEFLGKALTISLRYCAFRRQFKTAPDGGERKVLDYQLVQYRLLPYLADAFAYFFVLKFLHHEYALMKQEFQQGNDSKLGPLHALISGLKAFCTWNALKGVEECRQSCGGHGYLKSAGFSYPYEACSSVVTLEGDNTVMAQQTAKYLIKNYFRAVQG